MQLSPAFLNVPHKDDLDYSQFLLSDSDEEQFKNLMTSEILVSWRQNDLTTAIPSYPPNKYSSEMSSKSQKLHAGVILKNELKTGDMHDILTYCTQYIAPEEKKIPYRGDVGTYKVAKKALNVSDQDLPFVPCIGPFYLQMEWCQLIFDLFYDETSGRDTGALHALRVILNAKQVPPPAEIRKNYYATNLFLDKVLDSFLVELFKLKDLRNGFSQEDVDKAGIEVCDLIFNSKELPELLSNRCPVCQAFHLGARRESRRCI
ncbi:uncharacterized protein [Watersipora subatra]|uniref:uncharacterized protein isoform X2 n=1 Tax=Watersipora subatra TaxID=2589382 RepID=UPI00355B9598